MRLTQIPQLARNANRLREIITILSKYSLADWISRLDLDFARRMLPFKSKNGEPRPRLTHETRVRLALTELGTTFIKLGQMLSTRADLVGPALAKELSLLQTAAPADSPEVVHATIEAELGRPIKDLFAEFDDEPLASASIGQVHRARLADGRQVVVKVQHPGIEARIRNDLEILVGVAEIVEGNVAELARYRPTATSAEFQRMLLRELDFGREERHLEQFIANFASDPTVRFPAPLPDLSTSRVLTMEYLDGTRLAEARRLELAGADLSELARRGATVFLEMIFRDGFYHADPHPGNILVLPDQVIGMIDCGMVGRLDEELREAIEEVLRSIMTGNAAKLTDTITRIGKVPPRLDQAALGQDVAEFLSYYGSRPMSKLDLGGALTEMTGIIARYEIALPSSAALLIKVLVMLEGTSRLLNPQFELISLIRPFQKRLLWRYLSPARRMRKLRDLLQEWEALGRALPRSLADIIQQVRNGRIEVHLEHNRLLTAANRLVLGLLTSALIVSSAMILAHPVPPTIEGVSVPGALGAIGSLMLAMLTFWKMRGGEERGR
jgi:ubiquinone biosynthesis protein